MRESEKRQFIQPTILGPFVSSTTKLKLFQNEYWLEAMRSNYHTDQRVMNECRILIKRTSLLIDDKYPDVFDLVQAQETFRRNFVSETLEVRGTEDIFVPVNASLEWMRALHKKRKKCLKKLAKKSKSDTFFSTMLALNDFLFATATFEINKFQTMELYTKICMPIEQLMQILTDYKHMNDEVFKELLASHLTLQNDLIQILGELNVLAEANAMILMLNDRLEIKVEELQEEFVVLLHSAYKITDMYDKNDEYTENLNHQIRSNIDAKQTDGIIRELNAMNKITKKQLE